MQIYITVHTIRFHNLDNDALVCMKTDHIHVQIVQSQHKETWKKWPMYEMWLF